MPKLHWAGYFYDKNLSVKTTAYPAAVVRAGLCFRRYMARTSNGTLVVDLADIPCAWWMHACCRVKIFLEMNAPPVWKRKQRNRCRIMPRWDSAERMAESLLTVYCVLSSISHYKELFTFVYGDTIVTEPRMGVFWYNLYAAYTVLDAKYDAGWSQVANDNQPFPNFTAHRKTTVKIYIL